MTTKQKALTVILALVLFISLYIAFFKHSTTQMTSMRPADMLDKLHVSDMPSTRSHEVQQNYSSKPSRFLIMIQTSKCPTDLTAKDIFGNVEKCNCDVLVLTYEAKCLKLPPAAHIEYIFKTNTTWNTGRNLMLETAKNRTEKYLYYIFIDDDIKLKTKLKGINPWWKVLEFLTRVEPAVGVVDYTWNVEKTILAMKRLGCEVNKAAIEYLNAPNFDSAFNAFHYQAVDYILPYPTTFDNISWLWSGSYVKIMCDLVFPGHTVALTKINIVNPQHRPYPRQLPHDMDSWGIIMKEVAAHLPKKYQNTTLFKDWKTIGYLNEEKSISHCFSHPAPCAPLTPYSHPEYH